jgi:hypothetical protein
MVITGLLVLMSGDSTIMVTTHVVYHLDARGGTPLSTLDPSVAGA